MYDVNIYRHKRLLPNLVLFPQCVRFSISSYGNATRTYFYASLQAMFSSSVDQYRHTDIDSVFCRVNSFNFGMISLFHLDSVCDMFVLSSDIETTRDTDYADTMRAASAARYVSFNNFFFSILKFSTNEFYFSES